MAGNPDSFLKRTSKGLSVLAFETSKHSRIMKKRMRVGALQKEVKADLRDLGRLVYDAIKGERPDVLKDEEVALLVENIDRSNEEIEKLREAISRISRVKKHFDAEELPEDEDEDAAAAPAEAAAEAPATPPVQAQNQELETEKPGDAAVATEQVSPVEEPAEPAPVAEEAPTEAEAAPEEATAEDEGGEDEPIAEAAGQDEDAGEEEPALEEAPKKKSAKRPSSARRKKAASSTSKSKSASSGGKQKDKA